MSTSNTASSFRYMLLPLGAALIWSVNMIVTKMAADVIAPTVIGFYRWVLAGVLLTPIALPGVWRQRREIRPYLGKLAILGGLGMALYQGLAYVAAATTTASNMGIITSMIPLLTIAVAALVLHTRPTLVALIGCLVSLFGLSVLLGHGDPMQLLKVGGSQGDALMGLAALAYALYGVLLRKWALPIGPWQSLYVQVFFGIVLQLPAFLLSAASPLSAQNIPLVIYAGIFPSLFAPFLWMQGVRYLGPSRASIFLNIMPVATVAIAVSVLNEPLHGYHVLGGTMALAGVMIAQLPADVLRAWFK